MPRRLWEVGLTEEAKRDLASILGWTGREFGAEQSRRYRATITATVADLAEGPSVRGSRDRGDLMPGLRALHVARKGRRGRHMLLYRIVGEQAIEVLRILHDAMDPARHLPDEAE